MFILLIYPQFPLPSPLSFLLLILPFTPYLWCQHRLHCCLLLMSPPPPLFHHLPIFHLLNFPLHLLLLSPPNHSLVSHNFFFFFFLDQCLSVCDSQERGEECSEHVRSSKIPLGFGEQWGVLLLILSGFESCYQRSIPIPHLSRWPGNLSLSWSGAEQPG